MGLGLLVLVVVAVLVLVELDLEPVVLVDVADLGRVERGGLHDVPGADDLRALDGVGERLVRDVERRYGGEQLGERSGGHAPTLARHLTRR
jgi:hypothetical protein